jgi:hypothetical protein
MATHVKVIAVLYLMCGVMLLLAAFFTPLILGFVASIVGTSGEQDATTVATFLGFTGIAMSAVLFVLAAPFIATGWGMLKFRPWSRIAGIVMGALCLPQMPLGTVIGVYALVILFRKDTEALFATPGQVRT